MPRVLYDRRIEFGPGEFASMRAWEVPPSEAVPEGVRFAFTYLRGGRREYGIDNAHGKGAHEHQGESARALSTAPWRTHLAHFLEHVGGIRGRGR